MHRSQERRAVACPECGATDRFVVVAQQVSVDALRLAVRAERVIVACAGCQQASEITHAGAMRFKGRAAMPASGQADPAANGPPPEPEEMDTDLPRAFRGKR